jgi:outer membrane protein assembly factor BamB
VVNDRLYIAGENGNARCINPHTGKQIWKTFLGGVGPGTKGGSNGSETSPAVADGEFYAATYDGDLFSLRTSDGKRRWKARTHADTDASPVIYGDMVYTAAEEESPRVRAFRRKDGKEQWNFKASVGFWSTPALSGGRLYVGCDNRRLYCLDAKTGKHIWDYKTPGAIWSSPCVVDGKVIVGSNAGYLFMFDAKTGKKIWETRTPGRGRILSSPCIVNGHIWIGTATGWFMHYGP